MHELAAKISSGMLTLVLKGHGDAQFTFTTLSGLVIEEMYVEEALLILIITCERFYMGYEKESYTAEGIR